MDGKTSRLFNKKSNRPQTSMKMYNTVDDADDVVDDKYDDEEDDSVEDHR